MKAGQSSIVSELLMIAISLFLVAVVVGILNNLMTRLTTTFVPERASQLNSLRVLSVYGLLPSPNASTIKILALTLYVTSSAELRGAEVYQGGSLACGYSAFVLYGPYGDTQNCEALIPAGYYGLFPEDPDEEDSLAPGTLYFSVGCGWPVKAISFLDVGQGWYSPEGAPPWALLGTFAVNFLPLAGKSETYLSNTTGNIKFDRYVGRVKVLNNGTAWLYAAAYETLKLSKGTYTLLLWCPNLNLPLSQVKVVLESSPYNVVVYGPHPP